MSTSTHKDIVKGIFILGQVDSLVSAVGRALGHEIVLRTYITWRDKKVHKLRRSPREWGPYIWRMMHRVASSATSTSSFLQFLDVLQPLLPCAKCSRNMALHMQRLDRTLHPAAMVVWLHNEVERHKKGSV